MKNVHHRRFDASPEHIAPWIARAWSGTDDDVFPRDHIRTWRRNPPGTADEALVPGRTHLGHGPFTFVLDRWDGTTWRVRFHTRGLDGWHGFDLRPEDGGGGTLITHTIEARTTPLQWLWWKLVIQPLHDWAVEALFDRLDAALRDGRVPTRTTRPLRGRTRWLMTALQRPRATPPHARKNSRDPAAHC